MGFKERNLNEYQFEHYVDPDYKSQTLSAHHEGYLGGYIEWEPKYEHEIQMIKVYPGHTKQGLATELYRRAKEIDPKISHSPERSDAGEAWARTLGEDLPKRRIL